MPAKEASNDYIYGVVETLRWTLPGPDNRWPTIQQEKRMYELAIIKVLLRYLDESNDNETTLKIFHNGLLEIENANPTWRNQIALNLIRDLIAEAID